MLQPAAPRATGVALKDPKLFREQCYIDGKWLNADKGGTIDVDNPATGLSIGLSNGS